MIEKWWEAHVFEFLVGGILCAIVFVIAIWAWIVDRRAKEYVVHAVCDSALDEQCANCTEQATHSVKGSVPAWALQPWVLNTFLCCRCLRRAFGAGVPCFRGRK